MKIALIITVLNEEKTIGALLTSIGSQTRKPDEVIVVDGGSTDRTLSLISNKKIKVIKKLGNRAVGRNEAIRHASSEIILCSDAGCTLDKNWVKEISKPFEKKEAQVVAGFYAAKAKSTFQKALVPYVLVMPQNLNEQTFLPATRSMAFKKDVWKKLGGFDERYSHNEDYVLAQKLKAYKVPIVVAKKAIVYWMPPSSLQSAAKMFFRFAMGDAEAGIIRPKVILLFLRYILAFLILLIYGRYYPILSISAVLGVVYSFWAVLKASDYPLPLFSYFWTPIIQIVSDFAVMLGSIVGLVKRFAR